MDVTQIASMATGLKQMQLQQEIGFSVLKMAMDGAGGGGNEQSLEQLMQSMNQAVQLAAQPNLGANIDVSV